MYSFSDGYLKFSSLLDSIIVTPIRIGIAVSGGADSVLLFYYLHRYAQENHSKIAFFMIIHIIDGHHIIDNELVEFVDSVKSLIFSLRDQFQVECLLCENKDITIFDKGESIELVCHKLRKKYFAKVIKEYNLDKIVIGHTEDDQIEHFFIALARQSSLERISGMKVISDRYIRPLLFMSKDNIRKILLDSKLLFYDDPCNKRIEYLRNNIRKNIVPLLNKVDHRLKNGILEAMHKIQLANQYIHDEVEKLFLLGNNSIYNIDFFLQFNYLLQYKILEKLCMQKFNLVIKKSFYIEFINFLRNKKNNKHIIGKILVTKIKKYFFLSLNFDI